MSTEMQLRSTDEIASVISDLAEPIPLPAARLNADGRPRYIAYVPAAALASEAGRARFVAEGENGVEVEVRIFLDEQLRDGDQVVDIDAGWGQVALDAVTAAGRRVRVLAAVETATERAVLERAAREAPCTGSLDVVMLADLPAALGSLAAARMFVRASAAARVIEQLDSLHAPVAAGRVAAIAWPSKGADEEARLRDALAAHGFRLFQFAVVAGEAQLFPLEADEAAQIVFALSGAYLRSLEAPEEPAVPVELRAAHERMREAPRPLVPVAVPALDINLTAPMDGNAPGPLAVSLAAELQRAGHRVALFTRGEDRLDPAVAASIAPAIARRGTFSPSAPSLRVARPDNLAEHVGRGVRIALPVFELTRFTPSERHHLNSQDHLLVPSAWAASVLEANGIRTPVSVAPFGVDRGVFHERVPGDLLEVTGPAQVRHERSLDVGKGDAVRLEIWREGRSSYHARERETVFLNVGAFSRRKGQDVLIRAFEAAFGPGDAIRLVLACHNPALDEAGNRAWRERLRQSPLSSRIVALNGPLPSRDAVARLMASADCGVFPARAESWNLPLLEMLSVGRAVIATAYSGPTEFLRPDNARLIEIDALERADHGADGAEWAALGAAQLEQLVEHLREVHRLKQDGVLGENTAGIAVAELFSWRNAALTLAGHLAPLAR